MNKKILNSRYYQIIAVIIILVLALCVRLFMLTVLQEEKWVEAAKNQNTKEVIISAPRGEIYDRYGRVLAANKQIFTVVFNVSGLETGDINNSAYEIIKLFEKNGDEYVDNFPIIITANGSFKYTYDINKKKYLKSMGMSYDATAEDVLNKLRIEYEIDPDADRYEAMNILQEQHGIWPPINVRSMTFAFDARKKLFLEKYDIYTEQKNKKTGQKEKVYEMPAKDAFMALKTKYNLDKPLEEGGGILSDEDVRKIFNIREEIKNTGYNKYRSSTIATDVSDETVAYIEEMGNLLPGVDVVSDTVRVYPNGKLASHILGYMGSIADSQYDKYVNELGYNAEDLIGKDGIEYTMESMLRGKDGIKTILVNSGGDYMETISETEPLAGSNVYLTIDKDLQKVSEKALKEAIQATASGGVFNSKYGNLRLRKYGNCASGAVVAIDVDTAEIISMASFPDYNPNIFAEGISAKDWASVQSVNPRDSLAPTPLYNNATQSSVQPGSTFKPITAVAALQCGLDPKRPIYDKGFITIGDRTFGCSLWNNYRGSHGTETLATGIQNSCNYYFYCIASGKDWRTGASLGYTKEINIEKIMQVASEFGLGDKTGIELNESTTSLASAEKKLQSTKYALRQYLKSRAEIYWPKKIAADEEALAKDVDTIVSWTEDNPDRGEIIKRIRKNTSVKDNKVETLADVCKYSYFSMAAWTIGDTFNISIGQGDNAYTPLQMSNYVATLGNAGKRNPVTIVKGIEGQSREKSGKPYQIDVSKQELDTVIEGMKLVAKRGTLAGVFSHFPVDVAGKTGTAQKDGKINPKDEVEYIKKNLGRIAPDVSWDQVERAMAKLMKEDPKKYYDENNTVDAALMKVGGSKLTMTKINEYKDSYDNFAWTIAMAPADKPKIAVVVLLIQGGISTNAAPVAREIIGSYLNVMGENEESAYLDFSTRMN